MQDWRVRCSCRRPTVPRGNWSEWARRVKYRRVIFPENRAFNQRSTPHRDGRSIPLQPTPPEQGRMPDCPMRLPIFLPLTFSCPLQLQTSPERSRIAARVQPISANSNQSQCIGGQEHGWGRKIKKTGPSCGIPSFCPSHFPAHTNNRRRPQRPHTAARVHSIQPHPNNADASAGRKMGKAGK